MKRFLDHLQWRTMLVVCLASLIIGYGVGNLLPITTAVATTSQLVYVSDGSTHILDLETGHQFNLGNLSSANPNQRAVSPDGQMIASWSMLEPPNWRLEFVNPVTGEREEVGEFAISFPTLSWSPNSQQLVFAAMPEDKPFDASNHELFIMDIETHEMRPLTSNTVMDYSPVFSPDGRQLAFTSAADGFNRLYILDIATGASRIVTDQAFGYVPAWSPDGKQLVFESNHEELYNQIYTINTDGTSLRRLTFNNASNEFPFWLHSCLR